MRLKAGQDWKNNDALASETRRAEAELDGHGRLLIRPSGTEPLLRVMVEARDEVQSRATAERIAQAVRAGDANRVVPPPLP